MENFTRKGFVKQAHWMQFAASLTLIQITFSLLRKPQVSSSLPSQAFKSFEQSYLASMPTTLGAREKLFRDIKATNQHSSDHHYVCIMHA